MSTADPRFDILEVLDVAFLDLGDGEKAHARDAIEQCVRHIDRRCDGIVHVRVAVEQPQRAQAQGNPWRVRVEVTARGHVDCVAVSEPGDHDARTPLRTVIKDTFRAVERQLLASRDRQRNQVKQPAFGPTQEAVEGIVAVVYREEGYGFLEALDGREVYFHRNAVLADRFDELHPGVRVRFEDEPGEQGPQATFVHVLGPVPGPEPDESQSGSRRSPV